MKKSRKDDVINIANCMIRKNGYSNLSFSQVAQALGVTRENVHHYFRKKESLGNACIEAMAKELNEKFDEIISKDINATLKLKEYFKIYKTQQSDKEDCPIVNLLSEYDLLPTSMQEGVKKLSKIEYENMVKILEQGKEQGDFTIFCEISLKAKATIALLKGSVGYNKIYENFKDITEYLLEDLKVK